MEELGAAVSGPDMPLPSGAAPDAPKTIPGAGVFYALDSRRVSLREYRRGGGLIQFPLMAALKALRVQVPTSIDDPCVESFGPFEVAEAAVPEPARAALAPLLEELAPLGFHSPVFHLIEDLTGGTRTVLVTLAHHAGRALAQLQWRLWCAPQPPRTYLFTQFLTAYAGGDFLWSTSAKPDMLAPPPCRVVRQVGARPAALWARHEAALQQHAPAGALLPVRTADEALAVAEAHHAAVRDFHLARGVFRPLTDAELACQAELEHARAQAPDTSFEDAAIYSRMLGLRNKRAGLGATLLILAVSLALFIGAGSVAWSWEFVLLLVPILFVHELGHYLAMKLFGYRDLRMFFIPLLGAAVSGRAMHVAGWKQALVALAGPVPGIALGMALGVAGLLLDKPLLLTAAVLTLILNGFNLLPFLPLDGGRVVQLVLFSRHYALDVVCRVIAAVGLFGLGAALQERFLMILAAVMLVSVPMALRLGRITDELRAAGTPLGDAGQAQIPPAAALAVIGKVRAAFRDKLGSKACAQHSLLVVEAVHARPPGVLASLGLLGLHGASLLMALVLTAVFVIAQHGNLLGFASVAATTAHYTPLDPATMQNWEGSAARADANTARFTIIADFENEAAAQQQYASLQPRLPATAQMLLLGKGLLLSMPAGDDPLRQQWVDELQQHTQNVAVQTAEYLRGMSLLCIAPSEAEAQRIEEELSEHLSLPAQERLIPPWSERGTPEQRQAQRAARATYRKVQSSAYGGLDDPRIQENFKKVLEAHRVGDKARVQALEAERLRLVEEGQRRQMEALRAEPDIVVEVLDRYMRVEQPDEDEGYMEYQRRLGDELAPLLGQFELVEGKPDPQAGAASRAGWVRREGLLLNLTAMTFEHPPEGIQALVAWLASRGCAGFKYQLGSEFDRLFDLED